MRYYSIKITDATSGVLFQPPGFAGLLGDASYTSFVNGITLPNAWNVELDVPVLNSATPMGFALARVWGISLAEIKQSADLNGKNISVFGGMQKGLPLAKPQQSGLLVSGYIFQAFGNWIGTDMTLDLVIAPGMITSASKTGGIGTLDAPKNLVLNWPKGQPLGTALQQCLQTAFPGYTANVNISSQIVRPNDQIGYFPTLEQLASYCSQVSLAVVKTTNYPGVSIVLNGTTITAQDGTAAGSGQTTQIAFEDMIGQPTWLDGGTISLKTVMRADLAVGSPIMLPPAQITNTQLANSSLINLNATFQGGFSIQSLRHVGNFRQASADAWVTVIEAAPNMLVGAGQGDLG